MLNDTVVAQQFCPDNADLRSLDPANHFIEPIRFNDLGVVVQKQQKRTVRMSCPKIIDGRIVEGIFIINDTNLRITSNFIVEAESVRLGTSVFDNNYFKVLIAGYVPDARYTAL